MITINYQNQWLVIDYVYEPFSPGNYFVGDMEAYYKIVFISYQDGSAYDGNYEFIEEYFNQYMNE